MKTVALRYCDLVIDYNFVEWRKTLEHSFEKLIDSMFRRMQAVIDALGGNTKYSQEDWQSPILSENVKKYKI